MMAHVWVPWREDHVLDWMVGGEEKLFRGWDEDSERGEHGGEGASTTTSNVKHAGSPTSPEDDPRGEASPPPRRGGSSDSGIEVGQENHGGLAPAHDAGIGGKSASFWTKKLENIATNFTLCDRHELRMGALPLRWPRGLLSMKFELGI